MHFLAGMKENFARTQCDGARSLDQLFQVDLIEIGEERDVGL
jgi:hypothetical protein